MTGSVEAKMKKIPLDKPFSRILLKLHLLLSVITSYYPFSEKFKSDGAFLT